MVHFREINVKTKTAEWSFKKLNPYAWIHIAVVYDPVEPIVRAYMNGVEMLPLEMTIKKATRAGISDVVVAKSMDDDIKIDDMTYWDQALSSGQIQAVYNHERQGTAP